MARSLEGAQTSRGSQAELPQELRIPEDFDEPRPSRLGVRVVAIVLIFALALGGAILTLFNVGVFGDREEPRDDRGVVESL